MADISSYLASIERASRGEEVRDSIVSALRAVNTLGIDNCSNLGGRPAGYYATVSMLNTVKQNLLPEAFLVEVYPQDWDSNNTYSFENRFPSSTYNIIVQPGPNTTADQLNAIGAAGIVAGSLTNNTIRCVGTVPTINIQLMVLVVTK